MNKRNKGIILSYVNTFLGMVCGIFMSSFLLRQLGDSEYGLYQTISAFATYLVMLEFGSGTVMSRNIAICHSGNNNKEEINKNVTTIWYLNLALAALISIAAVAFYYCIGSIYSKSMTPAQIDTAKQIFIVITGYLIVSFFTQTMSGVLLGMEDYTFSQKLSLFKVVFRTSAIVVCILWKPYAMVIVSIDLIFGVLSFLATYVACKKKFEIKISPHYFDKRILVDVMPLCFAMLLQTLVNQANSSVDKFVIGIKMTMESVALYSIAQYIYSVFSSITTIPISMYLPQTAKDIASGKQGLALTDTFVQPCRLVTLLGGSVMFGFIAVGRQFTSVLYGEDKIAAWLYALIIIIPMFINMTNGVLVNVLDILKKRQYRSYVLILTTVLNIILTVIMIDRYGIIGAVIATAISTFIGQILIMNIFYSRQLHIKVMHLFYEAYKGILLNQMLACAVSYVLASFIPNNVGALFAGGITYVVISGTLIILWGMNDEEKAKMRSVRSAMIAKFQK